MMSLPYFAPIGDAALRFDTSDAVAKATLPDGLLTGGNGVAMSCWMTSPGEAETADPIVVVGNETGGLAFGFWKGHANVVQFTGPADGSSAHSSHGRGSRHTPSPAGTWVYLAFSLPDTDQGSVVSIDGGHPVVDIEPGIEKALTGFRHAKVAIVGRRHDGAWRTEDLGQYRGAITRLRLWRTALSADQLVAARFDLPVIPGAGQVPSPAVDWRMTEGYGDIAFDYAAPPSDRLPSRLGFPPGNHLRLGEGHAAPTWILANLPGRPHRMVRS